MVSSTVEASTWKAPKVLHSPSANVSLTDHGDSATDRPTPTRGHPSPDLSPADCHTIQKILDDVRSDSSASSLNAGEDDQSLPIFGDSDPCHEYDVQHSSKARINHAEEIEEGYKDEDESMELSDVSDEELKDDEVQDDDNDTTFIDFAEEGGDTIEDMMNIPGKVAAAAPVLDLSILYPETDARSQEIQQIERRRAELETAVIQEYLQQPFRHVIAPGKPNITKKIHDETQRSTGLESPSGQTSMELEPISPSERRATHVFAHKSSSDSGTILSPSFNHFASPGVRTSLTPPGAHYDYNTTVHTQDSPFTQALNYFKVHSTKKENLSHKTRRKAFLPGEIANLTREAEGGEEDDDDNDNDKEDLEKYRAMDLAPLEPVMDSDNAGDLITSGTPIYAQDISLPHGQSTSDTSGCPDPGLIVIAEDVQRCEIPELDSIESLGHGGSASVSSKLSQHTEGSDLETTDIQEGGDIEEHHPTFVRVISIVPKTLFWVIAAPVAKLANSAYDTMVEKLTVLEV